MINVIFNDINYKTDKFKKKKPQEYLRLIKWGRKYPTRFVEKILEIPLTDHQKYIFLSIWNSQSSCILASRASGKSFIIAVYIMARCLLFPNYEVALLSPDGKQSKLLLGKVEDLAKHRITTLKNKSNVFFNEVVKSPNSDGFHHSDFDYLTLYNGATITTYNSDPKRNVGVRCNLIVYDEAGKIPRETFALCDPFIAVSGAFQTGDINTECYPEQMPNQRILLSSAESIDTELFDTYKLCAMKMLEGDPNYFVVDLNCEMSLHPKMNGKDFAPLLTQDVIDDAMSKNEVKAMREYYNLFDNNNGENSVVRRSAIDRNSVTFAPMLASQSKDDKFLLIYDPAERIDNSFVLIVRYWHDDEEGWKMQIVNGINFIEMLPDGTKKIIAKPQQVERFKKIMLDYNGYNFGNKDWTNIEIYIDPGAGGGGYTVATYLLDNWKAEDGSIHFGIIDKSDKNMVLEASKFPTAKEVLHLPSAKGLKTEMFSCVSDMIEQNLVQFPKPLNIRQEFEYEIENPDGSRGIKYIKASKEEIRALTEIDLMITEICSMQKVKTQNGNIQIKLAANLERKMHDDRAYCLAMACYHLSQLRTKERLEKQKADNGWKKKYKDSNKPSNNSNSNIFNNDTNKVQRLNIRQVNGLFR